MPFLMVLGATKRSNRGWKVIQRIYGGGDGGGEGGGGNSIFEVS